MELSWRNTLHTKHRTLQFDQIECRGLNYLNSSPSHCMEFNLTGHGDDFQDWLSPTSRRCDIERRWCQCIRRRKSCDWSRQKSRRIQWQTTSNKPSFLPLQQTIPSLAFPSHLSFRVSINLEAQSTHYVRIKIMSVQSRCILNHDGA